MRPRLPDGENQAGPLVPGPPWSPISLLFAHTSEVAGCEAAPWGPSGPEEGLGAWVSRPGASRGRSLARAVRPPSPWGPAWPGGVHRGAGPVRTAGSAEPRAGSRPWAPAALGAGRREGPHFLRKRNLSGELGCLVPDPLSQRKGVSARAEATFPSSLLPPPPPFAHPHLQALILGEKRFCLQLWWLLCSALRQSRSFPSCADGGQARRLLPTSGTSWAVTRPGLPLHLLFCTTLRRLLCIE